MNRPQGCLVRSASATSVLRGPTLFTNLCARVDDQGLVDDRDLASEDRKLLLGLRLLVRSVLDRVVQLLLLLLLLLLLKLLQQLMHLSLLWHPQLGSGDQALVDGHQRVVDDDVGRVLKHVVHQTYEADLVGGDEAINVKKLLI